jgi:hypothetical protein
MKNFIVMDIDLLNEAAILLCDGESYACPIHEEKDGSLSFYFQGKKYLLDEC